MGNVEWTTYRQRIENEFRERLLTRSGRDLALGLEALLHAETRRLKVEEIAVAIRCSDRTVRRARTALTSRGLLVVNPGFEVVGGRRQQRGNLYKLTLPGDDQ